MVLLRGLNYDYSGQQQSSLKEKIDATKTELSLSNTEGFADNDYIIIDPNTDRAEIVQVAAAVTKQEKITITATKFPHGAGTTIYRTNFNQMKFYECATATGTYVLVDTIDMSYAENYTNYDYAGATVSYYYKRTFYNAETTAESAIADANYWVTSDNDLYVTPDEMRTYLQFDTNDYPSQADFRFFIKIAQVNVGLDMDSSSTNILFIATLLQGKVEVMRALATRAVSKGYIQVNAEGRIITKAYQELRLEAENAIQEYKGFILRNNRREATSTQFLDDNTLIDDYTRDDIINMMNGVTDGQDFQQKYGFRRL